MAAVLAPLVSFRVDSLWRFKGKTNLLVLLLPAFCHLRETGSLVLGLCSQRLGVWGLGYFLEECKDGGGGSSELSSEQQDTTFKLALRALVA